jgi:hypothetical protein
MTPTEKRDAARLDARLLNNLCKAADLIDALAEAGDPRKRQATLDIAGHLRNAAMHTPNITRLKLRDAEQDKHDLAMLLAMPAPRFHHSRQ